jgi:hypothetical protein
MKKSSKAMNIRTFSYVQTAVLIWLFDGFLLWSNFEQGNFIPTIISGILLFTLPPFGYVLYKLYIRSITSHQIKWPTDITYPYRIDVFSRCTVILDHDNLKWNTKETFLWFFREKASVAYSSINQVSAYIQSDENSSLVESLCVKYNDPTKKYKKSEIYIFVSWMREYDYAVLIKTLREKCPAGVFDENLLIDFEVGEQSMKRSNSSN